MANEAAGPGARYRRFMRRAMLPALLLPLLATVAAPAGQPRVTPKRHVVEIRGFEFEPAILQVSAGDTVTWINRDLVPHTATAGKEWDTGKVEAKGSSSVVV